MKFLMILTAGLFTAVTAGAAQAQDATNGEKIFKKCATCHSVGPGAKAKIGPPLNGVFGRKAGTFEGYSYSDANKNSGITWDEASFTTYMHDPKAMVPGTKMSFAGLKDDGDIKDLIAYLKPFKPDGSK